MMRATIVIPVFNRAHLVGRAIDSALDQTEPCQVIVVDHGSSDGIRSVMEKYEDRVRYIRRDHDAGPVAAWRHGVREATTEYVHITYDDDWLQPGFMQACIDAFTDSVAFVYTRVRLHRSGADAWEPSVLHPPGERPVNLLVRHLLRTPLSLSPGCAVFRKRDMVDNLLDQVPGAGGRYGPGTGVGEDLLLFLLTTLRYPRYVHLDRPLADFLAHDGSITTNALRRGTSRELAAAYDVAKEHYLSQPGAVTRDNGMRRFVSEVSWLVRSRSLRQYASKAARRLW